MIQLVHSTKDYRYLFVLHDSTKVKVKNKEVTEISLLEEYLNKIPSYQFLPSFSGIVRPVVFLDKMKVQGKVVHYCSAGLWKEIRDWGTREGVNVVGPDNSLKLTDFNLSIEEFTDLIKSWDLNITPRSYQIEAAWRILHYRCSLSQLATRAGKTLIAYIVFRYLLEHGAHNILMVVPSISLVKQGVEDMKEYKEFFKSEAIWAKGEYIQSSNLTIGTFQSLVKRCKKGRQKNKSYNPKFFEKFDVVCIDECHKADCQSIKDILSQDFVKNLKIRFGFSGTLPDEGTIDSFATQALLGPCVQDLTSRELIDSGFLTEPNITQIHIHYRDDDSLVRSYIKYGEYLCSTFEEENGKRILLNKEDRDMTMIYKKRKPIALIEARKNMDDREYMNFLVELCKASGSNLLNLEQMIAEHSEKKLDIIREIVFSWDKNGIVFAHNSEYIQHLYNYLSKTFPDRPVYVIRGNTPQKRREWIKEKLNSTDTNAILVASYGCVGTGLTFKNIDYCIFTQSFKSKIINLQSIGRGLLPSEGKQEFSVYDLIDYLPTRRLEYQGKAKIKTYKKVDYKYKVISR